MPGKEQGMDNACLFSVEVVASASQEGKLSLSSSSVSKPSCSLADHCDGEDGPALVRVGSCSESDNSSEVDGNYQVVDTLEFSASKLAVQVVKTTAFTTDDGGIYDCLTDQFSNLFCPADQQDSFHRSAAEATKADAQQMTSSCPDVATTSCTELQLQDILNVANPGSEIFSSLQFWLTPSQEETLSSRENKKPQNRSCSRKRRTDYIQRLWSNWYPENTIPIERSTSMPREPTPSLQDLQFDVYYDSDPEQEHREKRSRGESLTKKQNHKDRPPPPVQTFFYAGDSCSFDSFKPCPPTPRNSERQTFEFQSRGQSRGCSYESPVGIVDGPSFFESSVALTEFDLMHPDGDEILKQFVQEVTNARIKLVWHRHSAQDTSPTKKSTIPCSVRAPSAVTGIFEVGAHLDNLVVQPKFIWSSTYEPDLQNRKIHLSGGEPDAIELLSIIRVTSPQQLDRTLYPFARIDRTCCISTNDERFPFLVFEAATTEERDWLVTAMKMIVARLASIIIVRDENMLLEFFSPYSALTSLADGEYEYEEDQDQYENGPTLDPNDHDQYEDGPTLDYNGDLQLLSIDPYE